MRILLSEVGFHHVDYPIGRKSLFRIRLSLGVKDVVPDVAFEELDAGFVFSRDQKMKPRYTMGCGPSA